MVDERATEKQGAVRTSKDGGTLSSISRAVALQQGSPSETTGTTTTSSTKRAWSDKKVDPADGALQRRTVPASFVVQRLRFGVCFAFFFVIASRDEYIVLLNLSSNQYRDTRE